MSFGVLSRLGIVSTLRKRDSSRLTDFQALFSLKLWEYLPKCRSYFSFIIRIAHKNVMADQPNMSEGRGRL